MRRAKVHEVSSPISLFPFIGILLCTMGALIVVLVAVSRSARDTAERKVQSQHKQAAQPANDSVQKKLDELKHYVGSLDTVRTQAEHKIRDEQARLRHVEDHIRRLHEKMESLQLAAVELHKMAEEHYDDRQQAEREIARLHHVIADSKKTIAALQESGNKQSKSYAVVPYEGPNGTYRRPIYIECVANELIIQPEGLRIAANDLRLPLGPGNALSTVLRATRDHIVKQNPMVGQSRDTEPYALLLVRPEGYLIYYRGRRAVEAGDFDLGYELVESDWKLKFPPPDPQLAGIQQHALEQARARQVLLAAAAPRAYAQPGAVGEFDFDEYPSGGGLGSGGAGFGRGGRAGGTRAYVVRSNRSSDSVESDSDEPDDRARYGNSGGASGGAGGTSGGSAPDSGGVALSGTQPTSSAPGGVTGVAAGAAGPVGATGGTGNGGPQIGGSPDKNLVPDGYESTQQGTSVVAGTPAPADSSPPNADPDARTKNERANIAEQRGKDWALRQKSAKAVPIRRTIRVTVGNDKLTVMSDSARPASAERAIPLPGDTVEALDEFVNQVREQIEGWGIAGDGLYWRPVVLLHVAPDGEKRASDLTRLLKDSGLDIRTDATAKNVPPGSDYETR